jgi:hypothetical protein
MVRCCIRKAGAWNQCQPSVWEGPLRRQSQQRPPTRASPIDTIYTPPFWSTQREAMARKAFKSMLQLGDGGEALEGKGPGRNRFLFLATQGDTPVPNHSLHGG